MSDLSESLPIQAPRYVVEQVAEAEAALRRAREAAAKADIPEKERKAMAGALSSAIDMVGRTAKKVAVVMALGLASGLAPHMEAAERHDPQALVAEIDACIRAAEPRIAAIDNHEIRYDQPPRKAGRFERNHYGKAVMYRSGLHRTFLQAHKMLTPARVHETLIHEYTHHIQVSGEHSKEFHSLRRDLTANTAHCRGLMWWLAAVLAVIGVGY